MPSTPAKKATSSLRGLTDKDKDKSEGTQPVDGEFDRDEDYEDTKEDGPDLSNSVTIRPEDIKPPVDMTDTSDTNTNYHDNDKADKPVLSDQVVGTVPNKTTAELAAETPAQTAARYGIDQTISDEDANNPNVQVYRDTRVNQVPSGTHLHPDIAKDMLSRGISEQHTDNAAVKRMSTEYYSFAGDAPYNDKFQAPVLEQPETDNDEDATPPNAGSSS